MTTQGLSSVLDRSALLGAHFCGRHHGYSALARNERGVPDHRINDVVALAILVVGFAPVMFFKCPQCGCPYFRPGRGNYSEYAYRTPPGNPFLTHRVILILTTGIGERRGQRPPEKAQKRHGSVGQRTSAIARP